MRPPVGVLNKRSKEVKEVRKQESKEQGNEEQVLFPKRRSVSRCCGTTHQISIAVRPVSQVMERAT